MKKIFNDTIRVQKIDIDLLHSLNLYIPNSEYTQKYLSGEEVVGDDNWFEFVSFKGVDAINYFNKFDWLFNYEEMLSMNSDELYELEHTLIENKKNITDKSLSIDDVNSQNELLNQCKIIDSQLRTIDDVLMISSGYVFCNLKKTQSVEKNDKSIKKLVKSLFL